MRAGWVCGAGWSFTARYQGLELDALGDVVDRYGRYRDTPGLGGIGLTRDPATGAGPSACPVVLHGIDLFGHPRREVLDALGDGLPPTVRLRGDGEYLSAARIDAERVPTT
ncbi:hypothetical protein ACIBJD_23070 [Kitasatospora sp. NPDC050467]|uniref:hypothetical protein n=1 Tax=Kitasatospora sp. NPDC050467 TaxID=3364053 RepID=UPI0037BCD620